MSPVGFSGRTLEEYRASESRFHSDLMKTCRRYINELGIISITGILDLIKQEVVELEMATSKIERVEEPELECRDEVDSCSGEQIDK